MITKRFDINVIQKLIKEGKMFVYDFKIIEHFDIMVKQ